MRKIGFLVQLIGLTMLMSCKSGGFGNKGGEADQPYGEKSGIVTFKTMDMMGVKVTQTLYFDDYGKKEMRETMVEGNMSGMEMRQHTIDIRDGYTMYHYELENKTGGQDRATKNAYKSTLTPELLEQINVSKYSEKLKTKLSYKDEGKETVAGVEGTKYSIAPDSTNLENRITGVNYKNIPIKISIGPMEMIADKVEFGVSIPAEKFKVPEGYTIVEQPKEQMPQMPSEEPMGTEPEKK
ncbi:MAG: hypothetical protein WC780_14110 [Lentimicrobiaceae bacterium]|jgi:hypothetical protein